jgi:hypothetical protein
MVRCMPLSPVQIFWAAPGDRSFCRCLGRVEPAFTS